MNKSLGIILGIVILFVLVIASGAFYTIDETQQAVVTQFGEPIEKPLIMPGLHFKVPFIQTANYFEKRVLQWDGDPNQIPTRDKRYILVDTTARWRIVDALEFMRSVGTITSAQARLDDIIDSATRDMISSHNLVEAVRNSNRLLEDKETVLWEDEELEVSRTELETIKLGRETLSREILARASQIVPKYGIELVDVRIKRINYIQDVQNKVYERMISERKRAAEKFRSEGQGKKAEIEGQMTKELQEIQSEAYKRAQEIKGEADAKAITIYADAYNRDPDFYAFTKSLETYKNTIGSDTTLILTTKNEFYKQLQDIHVDHNAGGRNQD